MNELKAHYEAVCTKYKNSKFTKYESQIKEIIREEIELVSKYLKGKDA